MGLAIAETNYFEGAYLMPFFRAWIAETGRRSAAANCGRREVGHGFLSFCSALLGAEINIHYAYPLMLRPRGPAVALYVEDPTLAAQLLIRKGFTLIGESDLEE